MTLLWYFVGLAIGSILGALFTVTWVVKRDARRLGHDYAPEGTER